MSDDIKARPATSDHQIALLDILSLLERHGDRVTAEGMLALAANIVGRFIAVQDPKTMTQEKIAQVVQQNIQNGNQEALDEIIRMRGGHA